MSKSSDKSINILLLGETGAGKSTTLNALANYLKYGDNFEEAFASFNEMKEVIPTQFTLPHPDTGAPMTIGSGGDANERQNAGLSATIAPISYTFNYEHNSYRVIDTPGIGDTSGKQEDNANFDQILLHLQTQQKLNAILFVVKNSDARATAFFKYCISQLLLHLHKSVTANIIFCFTHSRSYMFGPGDGFKTLQAFLDNDYKEAHLTLIPGKNCFFIDNDWYRILIAKRMDYPVDEDTQLGYRPSYKKSANQFEKMLGTINSLPPHNLTETVSLNQARKIIFELAQPMIEMQTTIKRNIEEINKQTSLIKACSSNKEKLEILLKTKLWVLRSKKLDFPCTVCTGKKCVEEVMTEEGERTFYKTRCHENCYCIWVVENMINQFPLIFCKAMKMDIFRIVTFNTECNKCGCSWRMHKHIYCEYIKEEKNMFDVKAQIDNSKSEIDQLTQATDVKENLTREFEHELKTIQEISAKFGYLLSSNSYITSNKVFEDYVQNLINEEINKKFPNVEPLKRLKNEHENGVLILTDSIKIGKENPVRLEDIPVLKQQLLNLKHNGKNFRQILEISQRAKEEKFKYQEKEVSIGAKKSTKS